MKKVLSILLLSVAVTACVSAPSTTPSEVALKPASLGLSDTATPEIADAWWKAFGDAQLDTLVEQAFKGNPSLAAALARVREAQSQLASSTAATYPQITFDGNETRERFSKDYIIPPPYAGTTQWIGTVQAQLSYSLDLFGKEHAGIERARASAKAADLDATAARLLLAGAVTQSYIALSRAYVLADVAEEAVKQREGVFTLTQGRVRAGLDTLASQKQAEVLLAIAREDLIRADTNRRYAIPAHDACASGRNSAASPQRSVRRSTAHRGTVVPDYRSHAELPSARGTAARHSRSPGRICGVSGISPPNCSASRNGRTGTGSLRRRCTRRA